MFSVRLHNDSIIKGNVKRRAGITSIPIASVEAVSNGNIASKNIYTDNSVEISVDISTCSLANFIVLQFQNVIIVGEITGLSYVNDNNTSVDYAVDYFTSAVMTNSICGNFFTGAQGLCARTNLTYGGESIVNQLPEPFGGNTITEYHEELSHIFNDNINNATQTDTIYSIITNNGYVFVVWISAFAAHALMVNGTPIQQSVTPNFIRNVSIPNINTIATMPDFTLAFSPLTYWAGSYNPGIPIAFDNINHMALFIDRMLSNVGIRVIIPPTGLNNDGVARQLVDVSNQNFISIGTTSSTIEMEQVKMITDNDVLQVMILPNRFTTSSNNSSPLFNNFVVNTGYNLSNFNPLQDERTVVLPDGTVVHDYSKSKAMTYPYWYFELVTRTGNIIPIYPQTNMGRNGLFNNFTINCWTKMCGGNTPKTFIAITQSDDNAHPSFPNSSVEWIVLAEYPSISWRANVSTIQQLNDLQTRFKQSATINSALINSSTSGSGFLYGVRGGRSQNTQSVIQREMTRLGNRFSNFLDNTGGNSDVFSNNFRNREQEQLNLDTIQNNAGNIVTSGGNQVTGENSNESLWTPAIKLYRKGYTNGELFAFCRYLDRQGQATNAIINPISNSGNIFGGNAVISGVGGRTFYQFNDIDVSGTMPVNFKNAIQNMFIGGCYLI